MIRYVLVKEQLTLVDGNVLVADDELIEVLEILRKRLVEVIAQLVEQRLLLLEQALYHLSIERAHELRHQFLLYLDLVARVAELH